MPDNLDSRRQPPRSVWGAALLVSLALVSSELGIGLPWAAEGGSSAVAVVGLVALAIGTVGLLTSVGAVAARRPTPLRRLGVALLVLSTAVVLVYVVAVPLAAAVDYVSRAPGVDRTRVGALGLSMGGEEALGAAARDDRIRAVVAEGVTGRSADDLGWLEPAYGWRGGLTLAIHRAQTWLADTLSSAGRPTPLGDAAAALGPRRALLIAAGRSSDEQHAARSIAARAPGAVEVWVVPEASHTRGLRQAPQEWEQRVTEFLDEALR